MQKIGMIENFIENFTFQIRRFITSDDDAIRVLIELHHRLQQQVGRKSTSHRKFLAELRNKAEEFGIEIVEVSKETNDNGDLLDKELNRVNAFNNLHESAIRTALEATQISKEAIDAAVSAALAVEFSRAADEENAPAGLPEKVFRRGKTFFETPRTEPIPLYGERDDKGMDAITFYERYWRPFERAGLLKQADLRRFDASLLTALRKACEERGLAPDQYIPPTKSEFIARKIARSGMTHDEIKQAERYLRHQERVARGNAGTHLDLE